MNSIPRNPANDITELAKERNRLAAERTLISWIQNCLALIGFGATFDRTFNALYQLFPQGNFIIDIQLTTIIGLSTIGLGIFLLVLAIAGYLTEVESLEREDYLDKPVHVFVLFSILVGAIILFGLIALIAVFTVTF